ncbi:MAG TPA: hypothetical protein VFG67_06840 [Oleiagrimonas sp.]|nr:hypothetical protein [Oleiagrimonas sp.]
MRRLLASLFLSLPLLAAGQAVAASGQAQQQDANSDQRTSAPTVTADAAIDSVLLPVWHAGGSQSWMLLTSSVSDSPTARPYHSLGFHGLGFASQSDGGLAYMFDSRWTAHAKVSQQSWLGAASIGSCLSANPAMRRTSCTDGRLTPQLIDSEIGATFRGDTYRVDMEVSKTRPMAASPLLPRVLPNASMTTSVNGLPFSMLENSTSLHARGRLAISDNSGIDVGAGVGRIRLLPGNMLGIDTLGQKSLSFGIDSGSVSGHIVGRVIQPETGAAAGILGPDHRWTSIDLGVTWQLPWQGSLSFGAQNLWSSGEAPTPKDGPKPDQSRIPYVQYHQDF